MDRKEGATSFMEKLFCVYKHTNLYNQKVYIGITCQKPEERWRKGEGYRDNIYFYRAIKKYGWDGFLHEILDFDLTQEEACSKEIEYIQLYNARDKNYGYNIAIGGNLSPMQGRHHSKESNEKNRQAHLGKKLTQEQKEKISKRSQAMWDNYTEEEYRQHCQKIRDGIKIGEEHHSHGVTPVNAKQVICLDTLEVFASSRQATLAIGKSPDSSAIRTLCRQKDPNKTRYGLHWMWYEDYLKMESVKGEEKCQEI